MITITSKPLLFGVAALLAVLCGSASAQSNMNTTIQEGRVNINRTFQCGDSSDNATDQSGRVNINHTIQRCGNNKNQTAQFGGSNHNRTEQGRGLPALRARSQRLQANPGRSKR
jgi:hypothetical protein